MVGARCSGFVVKRLYERGWSFRVSKSQMEIWASFYDIKSECKEGEGNDG